MKPERLPKAIEINSGGTINIIYTYKHKKESHPLKRGWLKKRVASCCLGYLSGVKV
jgi:hypothetical protein